MQQFLRLLSPSYRQVTPIESLKLGPSNQIISQQTLDNYSPQLKQIYEHFFNNRKQKIQTNKLMSAYFQTKKTKVPVCNKLFSRTESIYRCYDCFIHQSAVLCVACFQNGQHTGHRFKKIQSGGGNCDCGNPLALKKQGFCVNHTGKAQIPEIPQYQQNKFQQIISTMFNWFFELILKKQPAGELYLMTLAQFLTNLNKQSIYYNVLTFKLLTKKRFKQYCYIDEIFKLKGDRVCKVFNQLFFAIFSLEEFKVILTDKFLNAYNTIQQFQQTGFHSLYIQLMANDSIVFTLTKTYKNTIHLQKKKYSQQCYLEDLNFIASIADEPAFCFYELFFEKNGTVPLKFMDQIEADLESCSEEELNSGNNMHLVDLVSKNVKLENSFYILYSEIFKKTRNNQQLLRLVVCNLYKKLNQKQYSYKRNRAVLPYHRVFILGIFTAFKANIPKITFSQLQKYLNIQTKQQLLTFLKHNLKIILNCLYDFAQTYARRNYFDNYIILYARSGICCINYDYIFVRICGQIFSQIGQNFSQILTQLFKQLTTNTKRYNHALPQTKYEQVKAFLYLFELLIEVGTTSSYLILNNQRLKINNQELLQEKKLLFRDVISCLGSVTKEELVLLERYFLGSVGDQLLLEFSEFNKSNKKYYAKKDDKAIISNTMLDQKQQIKQKASTFQYNNHMSRRKVGLQLFKQTSTKSASQTQKAPQNSHTQTSNPYLQKHHKILQTILPIQIITLVVQYMQQNDKNKKLKQLKIQQQLDMPILLANTLQDIKQKQNIYNNFMILLKKIQRCQPLDQLSLYKQKQSIIQDRLNKLIPHVQITQTSITNKKSIQKQRLQMLRKRQSQKKQKFLKKQNSIMQKFATETDKNNQQKMQLQQQEQQQVELICILCRAESKSSQSLCYFSQLRYKKIYSQSSISQDYQNRNGFGFIYNSCFHTTHYSCFQLLCQNSSKLNCPLCKSYSNILLPIQTEYINSTFTQSMKKISQIIQSFKIPIRMQQQQKNNQNQQLIKSFFDSLIEYIGFFGIYNAEEFQKRIWRICKQLTNTIYLLWKNMKEDQRNSIRNYLEKEILLCGEGKLINQGQLNEKIQKQALFKAIKQCVLKSYLQVIIQGKQLDTKKFKNIYSKRIHENDLKNLKHNIQLVLTNNPQNKQQQSPQKIQTQPNSKNLKQLKQIYRFYTPPKTPRELIKLRDQLTTKNCKNGHNVCFCCQCSEIFCLDCQTVRKHCREHGSQAMFFSLLSGGVILFISRQVNLPSLYQNKLGTPWTYNKQPEGFELNQQLYKKLTYNLAFHTIHNLLRNQFPEVLNGFFLDFQ